MTTELTVEHERQVVRQLLDLVADRAKREQEIESLHAREISDEQQQYQQVFQLLTENYQAESTYFEQAHNSERTAIEERCQNETTAIQQQYDQTLQEIDERRSTEIASAQRERDEAGWMLASLLDEDTDHSPMARLQALQTGMAASRTELEISLKTLDGWYRQATDFLQRCRLLGEVTMPPPSVLPMDLNGLHEFCMEGLRESEPVYRRVMRQIIPRLFRGFWPLVVFLLISGAMFALLWLLVPPSLIGLKVDAAASDWQWISAGIGSAFALILLFMLHLAAGHYAIPEYEKLMQLAVDADAAYQRWTQVAQRDYERQESDLERQHEIRQRKRDAAVAHADEKWSTRTTAANHLRDTEMGSANATFPARLDEIEKTRTRELRLADTRYEAACQDQLLRRERDFRNLQAAYDQRVNQSRNQYQQSWLQLVRDWHGGLREIGQTSDTLCKTLRQCCPEWSALLNGWMESRLQASVDDPTGNTTLHEFDTRGLLSIGRVVTDLLSIDEGVSSDQRMHVERTRFEFPVLMSLAEKPSLIIRTRGANRDAATQILQTAMLRFLTTLPAGKVRFAIFDPIGLGANFASFMHLTDIDEQMVTSRIWTEPSHIEKRLGDLTEHMENVLQTDLRNEYATLDDYNREAGEVAEPYRILVVANFPSNFTEISLRRLMSIAEGGVKCGVFMLVSVDETQDLPRGFSLADLERHATVFRLASTMKKSAAVDALKDLSDVTGSEHRSATRPADTRGLSHESFSPFRMVDPVLADWPVQIDAPPSADEFGQIVRLAGQLAKSVRRVEVPFERVMPPADAYWTHSTRAGVDVPIGRAGATKLQHLRLGKGTSQHVLIAGKTGSGKSSLLHALITNAALHYSPDEIEFYLIDFKKGVEFKTYATHRLPHARVIAIESDREFGVSVLQRLDTLLKDRGDLFRRVGVQDLAGFRDACPDQPLPRVLLVIDEFQEFFIEDDSLSQSAALLFDRLIRQGRAFGVHVLLGSQTLAGAYSLARSTLGQIAVRIALQCSDTDAHLILSEDNTAARLLSRPGEAIYNDANGLIEGNHPFQVVWLDDSKREIYLDWAHDWATQFQDRRDATDSTSQNGETSSRWPDAVVFEGNIAADPALNPMIVAAAEQIAQPEIRTPSTSAVMLRKCWLGEAVALTGPTELQFGPREGGPLLVVGRDDEAALGVLSASVLALAGQGAPARFLVLDGSLPDSISNRTWNALASLIPSMKIVSPRETAAALQELVDELHQRNDELAAPIFVIGFDLARFRDLKKAEDDFGGFGGFDKAKTANPAALFAEIVKDGPAAGIFPFVWCDGYQTAQRWLGRDLLNRFEVRVLFAMNSGDSSNLIDNPAAGRLGPNRALLYRGDLGTLDKFRPYKAPYLSWLEELRPVSVPVPQAHEDGPETVESRPDASAATVPSAESTTDADPTSDTAAPATINEEISDEWTDINEMNVQW